MAFNLGAVRIECEGLMKSTWGDLGEILPGIAVMRKNFLDKIEAAKIALPYGVLQIGKPAPTPDYGACAQSYLIPVGFYYICASADKKTTVTTGANSANQLVGSSAGFLVNQGVRFKGSNSARTISAIPDGTHITLNSSVNTTTGESIVANAQSVLEDRVSAMIAAIAMGKVFTNFETIEDPTADYSESLDANVLFLTGGFQQIACCVQQNLLIRT